MPEEEEKFVSLSHFVTCLTLLSWIAAFATFSVKSSALDDPFTLYGLFPALALIAVRLLPFLALPQTLCNFFGLVRWPWRKRGAVRLKTTPLLAPFVCFRVVTRGLYPKLVEETIAKNLQTIREVKFENFMFEIVVDSKSLALTAFKANDKVKEVVVPDAYEPKSGAKFKSRALQYCLEDGVNGLEDDHWIVHLDEETLLTPDSVRGIVNFVSDGRSDFGQGLIIYEAVGFGTRWTRLQNWACTVADAFRVADDLGKMRTQLKLFRRPIFSWKGSYVVTRCGAEKKVGFDNGPEGSKAEDCYFAILAIDQHPDLKFDFIEGEMREKSPFSFKDFFKQRQRWMQGIFMVVFSARLRMRSKILLGMSLWAWLSLPIVSVLNVFLVAAFPFSMGALADYGLAFMAAMALAMYGCGYVRQFPVRRYSWPRLVLAVPEVVTAATFSAIVENLAVCTMWFGSWNDFYIVQKESETNVVDLV